jgi:anti-sigma-K factor RskA
VKTLSPEERSQLAGEYVLGTLRGAARVRFERLVEDDPLLWQEVSFWEHRLGTLGEALPDLPPPDRILAAIAAEIGPDATKAEVRRGFWHSAPVWRGLTAMASGLAAILLVLTFLPNVDTGFQPVQVATLQNETDGSAWLVQIAADGMADVTAVGAAAPPAGRSYELWLLRGTDQAPVPLGVASVEAPKRLMLPASFSQGTGFAVSIEPEGGSPTGAPTGPVVFVGGLVGPARN